MTETREVKRILSGSLVSAGLSYTCRIANLVATILLTRMLLPEDFGNLALATFYFTLFASLKEFGLSYALLHHRDRAEEMAFTQLLLNSGLSGVGMSAVALLALLLRVDYPAQITSAIVLFAVVGFLRSTAYTPETLLRKDLEFGKTAVIQSAATLLSLGVALILAWTGKGFWSLVVGYSPHSITYALTLSLLLWVSRPVRIRQYGFRMDLAKLLLSFGLWYWFGGIVNVLLFQYDKFIVGTLRGTNALGVYERAYTFAQMPTGAITHVVIGITGAVYARYQKERKALSGAFTKVLGIILRVSAPIAMVLFVEAHELTRLLLGERWLELATILRWLVVYSFLRPLQDDIHALLLAMGQPKKTTLVGAIQASVLFILLPVLTSTHGLVGAALAMNGSSLLGAAMLLKYSLHYVDVPWRRIVVPPALAVTAAILTVHSISYLPQSSVLLVQVAIEVVVMLSAYTLILLATEGTRLLHEFRQLCRALRNDAEIEI